MSSPSSESPSDPTHRPLLARLIHSIFSSADDNNVMMAAIISLVVVILFVFILHLYARSSFHSRRHIRRRRRRSASSTRRFPPPSPLPPSFVLDLASKGGGLEPAAVAAIPLFVFEAAAGSELEDDDGAAAAECAICLSEFDGGEVGRRLPKCGHEFHVECVDMWLGSHSTCPICRAPVVPAAAPVVPSNSVPVDTAAVGVDRRSSSVIDNGDGFVTIEIVTAEENAVNISTGSDCSSSSSSSFGCSLKRMLSRNRSERKVFPAASVVNGTTTDP